MLTLSALVACSSSSPGGPASAGGTTGASADGGAAGSGVAGTGGTKSGGSSSDDGGGKSDVSTAGGGGADGASASADAGSAIMGSEAGGSGDASGSADGGSSVVMISCGQGAALDRTCMVDSDCVAVKHQTDAIGQYRLLGIRASEMARFTQLEASCHATTQGFNPPATTADDGSLVDSTSQAVACQMGACTTFSKLCGSPCAAGHVCITCGSGATMVSTCNQDCSMGACTEAPRTSCLGGTSTNGGEGEFCFDPKYNDGFMSSSCHR